MEVNAEQLSSDLLNYICFLFSTALGLQDEPKHYGVLRLITAAERVMEIMAKHKLSSSFLGELQHILDQRREQILHDENERQKFIKKTISNLVAESTKYLNV